MENDLNRRSDVITKFESMSNELLMEIFEYYDCYSLFSSLSSLNSRIDNLLDYCQVYVNLDRVQPIDFVDFLAHILPKINPKNIRSLHSSNLSQITVLASDKSLIYFTYIRSLSLKSIRANMIESIVSRIYFSRLERLLLDQYETYRENVWSLFKHFFDSNRYHFLRTYNAPCVDLGQITSISFIEHVTTSTAHTPWDVFNLLDQSPNLKSMNTEIYFDQQYRKFQFLSPIPYHHALHHLHIHLCGYICMKTVVYLFQCLPQISSLKLKVDEHFQPEFVDPIFWETCLSKNSIHLQRLSLFAFTAQSNPPNDLNWKCVTDTDKVLKQIEKSNYWSSHQSTIKFDSGISTPERRLYWAKFEVN